MLEALEPPSPPTYALQLGGLLQCRPCLQALGVIKPKAIEWGLISKFWVGQSYSRYTQVGFKLISVLVCTPSFLIFMH